jgi:capsular exopolysaccharide synthesis family protein
MSSIRDALKKAERERMSRGAGAEELAASRPSAAPEKLPDPPEAPEWVSPRQDASPRDSSFQVIQADAIPPLEIPVGFAEELANFRHGVESALPKPRRSLLMTSATSGEGVTTLTNFLATSLAIRDGKRTCLIDVNFKSPKTTRIYGLLGKPGFSDYCSGKCELGDALRKTESPDLFLMGLGTEIYNPSLILSHERARGLANELCQRFEYVLFDAGCLLGNSEASILSSCVDGTVLVVRANRTKREVLAKAEKLVRFGGGAVIGTVLNRRTFPIPDAIYKRL